MSHIQDIVTDLPGDDSYDMFSDMEVKSVDSASSVETIFCDKDKTNKIISDNILKKLENVKKIELAYKYNQRKHPIFSDNFLDNISESQETDSLQLDCDTLLELSDQLITSKSPTVLNVNYITSSYTNSDISNTSINTPYSSELELDTDDTDGWETEESNTDDTEESNTDDTEESNTDDTDGWNAGGTDGWNAGGTDGWNAGGWETEGSNAYSWLPNVNNSIIENNKNKTDESETKYNTPYISPNSHNNFLNTPVFTTNIPVFGLDTPDIPEPYSYTPTNPFECHVDIPPHDIELDTISFQRQELHNTSQCIEDGTDDTSEPLYGLILFLLTIILSSLHDA